MQSHTHPRWSRLRKLIRRPGWQVGALLFAFLSACTPPDFLIGYDTVNVENAKEVVAAADWKVAETIDIDIRQNEFNPPIIRLLKGEPYVMILENRDDVEHVFQAPEFFRQAAVLKLVQGEKEIPGGGFNSVHLKPGEVKEIHVVPTRDGWYPFEDGAPGIHFEGLFFSPLSRGVTHGSVGSFVVQE